jgi:hypothetical protein
MITIQLFNKLTRLKEGQTNFIMTKNLLPIFLLILKKILLKVYSDSQTGKKGRLLKSLMMMMIYPLTKKRPSGSIE